MGERPAKKARQGGASSLEPDPADPESFMKEHGYVLFRKAVPEELCVPLRAGAFGLAAGPAASADSRVAAIKVEIEMRMSMGSCHQEEPSENVCRQTASLLGEMQASKIRSAAYGPCCADVLTYAGLGPDEHREAQVRQECPCAG